MTDAVNFLIRRYLKLSAAEKADLTRELETYNNLKSETDRDVFKHRIETRLLSLGPKGSICDCCGAQNY